MRRLKWNRILKRLSPIGQRKIPHLSAHCTFELDGRVRINWFLFNEDETEIILSNQVLLSTRDIQESPSTHHIPFLLDTNVKHSKQFMTIDVDVRED